MITPWYKLHVPKVLHNKFYLEYLLKLAKCVPSFSSSTLHSKVAEYSCFKFICFRKTIHPKNKKQKNKNQKKTKQNKTKQKQVTEVFMEESMGEPVRSENSLPIIKRVNYLTKIYIHSSKTDMTMTNKTRQGQTQKLGIWTWLLTSLSFNWFWKCFTDFKSFFGSMFQRMWPHIWIVNSMVRKTISYLSDLSHWQVLLGIR